MFSYIKIAKSYLQTPFVFDVHNSLLWAKIFKKMICITLFPSLILVWLTMAANYSKQPRCSSAPLYRSWEGTPSQVQSLPLVTGGTRAALITCPIYSVHTIQLFWFPTGFSEGELSLRRGSFSQCAKNIATASLITSTEEVLFFVWLVCLSLCQQDCRTTPRPIAMNS